MLNKFESVMEKFIGDSMSKPKKPKIVHPTIFNKCLLRQAPNSPIVPSRKKEIIESKLSTSIVSYVYGSLPIAGVLKKNEQDFLYLDVDNGYISSLLPFFNDQSIDTPPFFQGSFSEGAHLSICAPYEQKTKFSSLPLGDAFCFDITGCFKAALLYDSENKYVWYLTVESKELQNLRTSLGLSPLPNGESFYITLGFKKTFLSLKDLLKEASKQHITVEKR